MSPRRGYCAFCEEERAFRPPRAHHSFHITLTVLTFGVWGVSYAALLIHRLFLAPLRCAHCGHRFRAEGNPKGAPSRPRRANHIHLQPPEPHAASA